MSLLSIQGISKRFGGVHALNGISLKIQPGMITGLVGPNGSGKTTLLNCISGTIIPDQGKVVYRGNTLSNNPNAAYYGGAVRTFQSARLFPQLTVCENLFLINDTKNIFRSLMSSKLEHKQEHAINQVLQQLGIYEKKNTLAGDLSYGQKKLVELARVLLANKDIILLDEPFAGLSAKIIPPVITLLKELKAKGNIVILVEHSMHIIEELCDEVVVLNVGEVLASGTPKRVFALNKVRKSYLGE